jgi:SPP1 family predicted phage head-tail adaptor
MRAGELRQRIKLESKTVTRNAFGEEVATWATLATVWAKIETVNGVETIAQQQAAALLTHKITIRVYAALQPVMRVNWNSRLFDVQAVLDDNLHRQMQLLCSEVKRG